MSQDIETKSDHSIGLNVSTNITNQTDSGTMGYKYLVYAMCNEYPTFEIPVANASEHCSNGVINESCCEVQENMYRKCICEYVEQGPFVFPVCHWSTECSVCSNSDICDDPLTSTPEISTSETSTITTEISTTEEITTKTNPFSTMSYTWPKDLECPELSQPKNGTIFCNSNFYECNLLCDPGFVPWQLKFDVENNNDISSSTTCDGNTGEWDNILSDECLKIEEVCGLNLYSLTADPKVSLKIAEREADSWKHLLGGFVYHAECDDGFVFEGTGKKYHKEKCICRFDNFQYSCSKSEFFDSELLGSCVEGKDDSGNQGNNNNDNIGELALGNNWLDYKRVKFTSFMRSLYDTFWYGASIGQAQML